MVQFILIIFPEYPTMKSGMRIPVKKTNIVASAHYGIINDVCSTFMQKETKKKKTQRTEDEIY